MKRRRSRQNATVGATWGTTDFAPTVPFRPFVFRLDWTIRSAILEIGDVSLPGLAPGDAGLRNDTSDPRTRAMKVIKVTEAHSWRSIAS